MKEKVNDYTNLLYSRLIYWTSKYHLDTYEMNDNLTKNKIMSLFENIIEQGNEFILTNDYLNYLCFVACFRQLVPMSRSDFLYEVYCKLVRLSFSYKEPQEAFYQYYHFLLFGQEMNIYDKINQFYDVMNEDEVKMFASCIDIKNKLCDSSYRPYEYNILKDLLIKIAYYCKKNNCIKDFNIITKKYFDNPRETLEKFKLMGLIIESTTAKDFDQYMENDFNNTKKDVVIK